MALGAALTPLVISATQGSADAFIQGSVLSGLSGRSAYNLRAVSFEITGYVASSLANASEISLAITRRSKAAMPAISDSDVLWKRQWQFKLTTSGAVFIPTMCGTDIIGLAELPLVEETLYAQLDSSTTAATLTAIIRMEVELDTMSDIDRLNLITRSLT